MLDDLLRLWDDDWGDELRCVITCQDCQTRIEVMSSDVWRRVRTMKAWTEVLGSDSDDVSELWRHGSRCWAQILMTCQDYEGMDRGVGFRFWWRVRIMKAWIEVLGSDSDDVSGLWRHGSRCWAQILTCQDYEGMDRGVDLTCLMTCQVHEANDRRVEDFRCLMTCKCLAEKSRRWLLRCLGFWGDKSRWRSRCCCKAVSLASKRSERKKEEEERKKKRTISGKKSGQKNRKGFLQGFDATAAGGMHLHRAKTVADFNGLHFARNCARWGVFCFYVLAIFFLILLQFASSPFFFMWTQCCSAE